MLPISSSLIVTKLTRPVLHTRLVHRERLIDRLRAGMQHKLTLLVAPAGFGKTTLLSEWLASPAAAGWPVAWFSLDEQDNDPARFWDYFTAALEPIHPNLRDLLAGIHWQEAERAEMLLITSLVNAISSTAESFSFVLDDYHLVTNEAIHDGLSRLLRYLPANVHLIISSRKEPPLEISRLRAQNDVIEIRYDDLKFTSAETNTFLTQIMGLALPGYQVNRLANLTEGWIAGLVLAVPALQHLSSPYEIDSFIAHFGGDYKYIFNFLPVEVLNHLTATQREFLLKTSILQELNADLCNTVVGISNSRAVLNELEALNLFLYPLNEQRQWYRYHTLFASSLQLHLAQTYPKEEINRLHLAACDWRRARGDIARAIPHAVAAGRDDLAAEILEDFLSNDCNRDALANSTREWFNLIPASILDRYPDLRIQWAVLCLVHGFFDQTETLLKELERSLTLPVNREIDVHLYQNRIQALRAAIQCVTGDYRQGIRQARLVLNTLEETDEPKILLEYYLAMAHQAGGDLAFDIDEWKAATRNHALRKDSGNYLFYQALLAQIYEQRGQLYLAAEVYQESLEYIQANNLENLLLSLIIQMGLSDIYREWNEREAGERLALKTKEQFLAYQTGEPCWLHSTRTCLLLAKNSISFGSLEDAGEYIDIAILRAQATNTIPSLMAMVDEVRVGYWLASGKTQMASAWARSKELLYGREDIGTAAVYRVLIAQVALAEKRYHELLAWLDSLLPELEAVSLGRLRFRARALRGLALWKMGRRQEAVQAMQAILPEAARENMVRGLVELHPDMEPLLKAVRQGLEKAESPIAAGSAAAQYVERALAAFNPEGNPGLAVYPAAVLDPTYEKLTEREMEVLSLLAVGLSSGRIAARLSISNSTAKTHIHNIYQKLRTNTRERSIDRARKLGLL